MPDRYIKHRCPQCNEFEISFHFFKKYFHLFWIPVFPTGSRQVAYCEKCGVTYQESIPPSLSLEMTNARAHTRTPWYMFSGIIVIILGVTAIVYFDDGMTTHYYASNARQAEGKYMNDKPEGKWMYWYENGNIQTEQFFKNGKEDSLWFWYSEDGKMIKEGRYKNGMYHGKWVFYFPNGKIQEEDMFFENRKHGPAASWYESGQKSFEGSYQRDRENGKWTYWFDNGKKMMEGEFAAGVKTGTWIYYYQSGKLNVEMLHKDSAERFIQYWEENGDLTVKDGYGRMRNFFADGKIESSGQIRDGLYDGPWSYWYADGKKREEGTFTNNHYKLINSWDKEGMPLVSRGNGYHKNYFANGVVAAECLYRDGEQHGLLLTRSEENIMTSTVNIVAGKSHGPASYFGPSGEPFSTGYFKNNFQDSTWTWFHLNGEKESQVNYVKGKKEGEQLFWSEMGEVVKREFYKNGELIGVVTSDEANGL